MATAAVADPTFRLIPSRFPSIATFATVSSADDLAAAMELEGWTNDRLVQERLARLPRDEWVYGSTNASIVMASFLHAALTGLRFTGPGLLGAWYASEAINTAIIEVSHHLRREARHSSMPEMRSEYRTYSATLDGAYEDIRGLQATRPALYATDDYSTSQPFGEDIRRLGGDGIVYDSVRHVGGVNVVAYRPRKIRDVIQRDHYELTVPLVGRIVVRRLAA
jgi:RES domain